MQVTIESGFRDKAQCELLAVPLTALDPARWKLPRGLAALDRAAGGRIAQAVGAGDFRGGRGESLLLHPAPELGAKRLVLLGLGPEASLDTNSLRALAGAAVREATARRAARIVLLAPASRRVRAAAMAQALAEGATLGAYRFDRYRTGDAKKEAFSVERLTLRFERQADARAARSGASAGTHLGECQNLARDLSNEPPNKLPPIALAREATRAGSEAGLRVRVLEPAELRRRGFGAMLAVAQGSANPPRLIVLEHGAPTAKANQAKKRAKKGAKKGSRPAPTVCLVGKGVCFDSGGLSLKPSMSMVKMKHDMSGGAAVIGALVAAARLRVPLHVVGIVGAVENMPSGTAYRPDDVVTTHSGQTVEISNTDAEGRLVLADALAFANDEYSPAAIIDLATLTGACAVALGNWAAAVLGNHDRLAERMLAAGEASGERYWRLPLWDVHREHMRGGVGDLKQTGGRNGGTITAAAFLSHFVGETPWIHLDIASVADTEMSSALQPRGATGFGVRSLIELLQGWGSLKL